VAAVDDKTEPSVRIRLTRYNGAALQAAAATVTRPVLPDSRLQRERYNIRAPRGAR